MCGIAAVYSLSEPLDPTLARSALASAVEAMPHRGPDATGVWVDPNGFAGLGHARLSIIDLTTGDQPIVGRDQRVHLVHNGEFYGYDTVRAEQAAAGYPFRTQSDSEIVIPLYERYGTGCLENLRGEFAFALWDSRQERLFAARDRFGIKPLYYSVHQGKLWLASEMKCLFAVGVPAQWDAEMVSQYHLGLLQHSSRTLFKNIFQIPPGHFLLASRGEVRLHPYWDFDYPTAVEKQNAPCLADAVVQVREALVESVKLRLRADVKVGCYLSGGIDSCSALGIAASLSQEPVAAFTLTFDDPAFDEGAVAKEMAAHAGTEFRPFAVRSAELAENFEAALWNAETPFHNGHGVAKYLLSREVRRAGYKVVLTGEGSDEIFAGYAHFRRDYLMSQSGEGAPVKSQLDELARKNQGSHLAQLPAQVSETVAGIRDRLGFVPTFFQNGAMMIQRTARYLNKEWRGQRETFGYFLDEIDVARQLKGREPVDQAMYLWSKNMLPNYQLSVLGDRMEMAHSVEGRLPFLDHKLVELVTRMPVSYKISGMTEKFLLREAAKPYLTETVYQRQKHPFLAPPAANREADPILELVQDTLRSNQCAPFYDRKALAGLLDQLPSMAPLERAGIDGFLMLALSTSLMNKCFKVS